MRGEEESGKRFHPDKDFSLSLSLSLSQTANVGNKEAVGFDEEEEHTDPEVQ